MQLLSTLFEQSELPTDFKEKTKVLFESALAEAVDEKIKAELLVLNESFDSKLAKEKATFVSESVALIDAVLEETTLEWAKENVVALEGQMTGQLAESFLQGIKGLLEKADVEMAVVDAGSELTKLQEQVSVLTKTVEEKSTALVESEKSIVTMKTKEITKQLTEGLADTVKHRFTRLCEAFEYKSAEDFQLKAAMVLEAITGGKTIEITGTQNADGTIIPVGTEKVKIAQVSMEATDPTDPIEVVNKPADEAQAALQEAFAQKKALNAPHYGEDLVAQTLKLMRSGK